MASNALDGAVHPAPSVLGSTTNSNQPSREEHALGLKAIYATCRALYPDQPSPLQVTALRKFWMGGPDPLDFINMYSNPGTSTSPPHWHYVTNGLSDLYGDSRLHSQCQRTNEPSGFGFELTLRIRRRPGEISPPTWPAHLLQTIARYVFYSQAQLMPGDHIPWPSSLDEPLPPTGMANPPAPPRAATPNRSVSVATAAAAAAAAAASLLNNNNNAVGVQRHQSAGQQQPASAYASMMAAALAAISSPSGSDSAAPSRDCRSLIRNMLLVEDSQLKRISTPYGYVQFLQLVGLFDEELRLVQRWSGSRVAEVMRDLVETGGDLLVTDMTRSLNLFHLKPEIVKYIRKKMHREGSNLTGVTTQFFAWAPITLAAIADLIPGELEAEVWRHSASSQCRILSNNQLRSSKPAVMSQTLVNPNADALMQTLPTDLSVHRGRASPPAGDADRPVAMVTDDTVVSATSTAKAVTAMDDEDGGQGVGEQEEEEEEFIDVVGDGTTSAGASGCPRGDKSTSTATAKVGCTSAPVGVISKWSSRLAAISQNVGTASGKDELQAPREPTSPASLSDLRASAPLDGPLGFPWATSAALAGPSSSSCCSPSLPHQGSITPGSAGSVPCTPLAHLSLSPGNLDLMPSQVLDCLDLYLCREAGEMLPLAVGDRLRHGRHFTFLNGHCPEQAVTLVPNGVSGAFVSEETPYVARGPWLQIYLPKDFQERLDFQFSSLAYPEDSVLSHLPLVFRWPERRLRICIVEPGTGVPPTVTTLAAASHSPVHRVPTRLPPPSPVFFGRPPPTCVPTPEAVMAAMANVHRQQQQQREPLEGFGYEAQTEATSLPSHDLTSQWIHLFSALLAGKYGELSPGELITRLMQQAAATGFSAPPPHAAGGSDVQMEGSWLG